MIEWLIRVQAVSPLALHAERASSQFVRALPYIPGSSLRGALADAYLKNGTADADFQRLFLDGACFFPNLYPCNKTEEGVPLPTTVRACKRYKMDHADSLSDALLPLHFHTENARKQWEACPVCKKNPRDRIEGYFRVEGDIRRLIKPRTRIVAGTSILRATQTAASGQLFSNTVVEEETWFSGRIRLTDESLADKLRAAFPSSLRIGYARSRGLGLVQVHLDESSGAAAPGLVARLDRFNAAVQAARQANGARYASLTLESDVLLRDDVLRPVTAIADGKPFGLNNATLERAFVVPALAQGWNAVLGLPKPDAPGLGRGSVFLFKLDDMADQERLAEMEANGIGERREEGFGRVRVCDPFHYEFFVGGE